MLGRQLGAYTIVNGVDTTPAFEAALGAPIGLQTAFPDCFHGVANVIPSIDLHVKVMGLSRPYLWTIGLCNDLADVVKGIEDANFKAVFAHIAGVQPIGRIIIRLMHEANGVKDQKATPSYPHWFAPGREAMWQTGWQRVTDIAKTVSDRFDFDWCVNHTVYLNNAYYDPRRFYPTAAARPKTIGGDLYLSAGDSLVDSEAIGWKKWGGGVGFDMIAAFAKSEGLRMSLAEWGIARDSAAFVNYAADLVEAGDVAFHCYFNDAGFQLKNFPKAQAAYRARFGQPVVTTAPTFQAPAGQPFSVPLTANQVVAKWGFTATPAGAAQLHAETLAVTGPAGSKVDLVVRAVNAYGGVGGKKVSVSFS